MKHNTIQYNYGKVEALESQRHFRAYQEESEKATSELMQIITKAEKEIYATVNPKNKNNFN